MNVRSYQQTLRSLCSSVRKLAWPKQVLTTRTMTSARQYGSIAALHRAYENGEANVVDVTKHYLSEIERLNGDLNAIVEVNKEAISVAEQLKNSRPDDRSPLFGVPILIKDQIETAGIPTRFGSVACNDYTPTSDATLVRRLKEAGAIILGKTTMPDWAAGFTSPSSLSGTTRHPIDPTRDPGGSSSGSATAVAANMALVAIGGDTGGSIRLPASFCGLVGVRVTPGRISRDGMSTLLKTQDTPGPMSKTVEDAARLLDVLVGYDEYDDFTSIEAFSNRREPSTMFQDAIKSPVLKGKRLGILRQEFGSHKGINSVLDKTLADLKKAGAKLTNVEIPNLEEYKAVTSAYVLRCKADINAFCASRKELSHIKIEDLQAAGTYHKSLVLIDMLSKGPSDFAQSPHFAKCLTQIDKFQRAIASLFAKNELDAIIYPTCKVLAPKTKVVVEGWDHMPNTIIASQSLFTAVSVPIGRAKDDDHPEDPSLPVGLEILGVPLSEERILNLAAGIEAMQR